MTNILIAVLFCGTLFYIYFDNLRRDRNDKDKFREFVRSVKSENIQQYVESLPSDEDVPEQEVSEFIPLDEMDPQQLLRNQ